MNILFYLHDEMEKFKNFTKRVFKLLVWLCNESFFRPENCVLGIHCELKRLVPGHEYTKESYERNGIGYSVFLRS